MLYQGFIGASYVSSSPAVDCERSMNLYPEVINAPGVTPKARTVLRRRPGLGLEQTLGDTPGRGGFRINGRVFAIVGGSFYELTSPTTSVKWGALANYGVSPVQFACNSTQILVLADGLGYIFTLATNTLTQIGGPSANAFPAYAVSCTSIDTYFIVLGSNSNQFAVSNPLDGLTWSGLSFGSSQEPDNAVAVANLHLYLWIFGQDETILFQDTGASSTPFQRVAGSQIEQGCGAAGSVVVADNTLFWLGSDARGPAVIYRADGLLPTRVSTHAVEAAIQSYPQTSDAVAYAIQSSGHLFYVIHFPSANAGAGATWAYDIASSMWHERGYWNAAAGTYGADLARFHVYGFGMHLALDYSSGNVYRISHDYATDNGQAIRWLRAAPHLSNEEEWVFYSSIQIDMETGGGLPSGADPQVIIRWSDDGGFTWSTPRQVSSGAAGAYTRRVKLYRCGRARNRVFEVSSTDPIPRLALIGAYLDVGRG